MSAISPVSIELVQIVTTMSVAHRANGSSIPLDDMPGHIVDAVRIVENESSVIESAMDDALYA